MNFAFRRSALALLLITAACGDPSIDCPDGSTLEGEVCTPVDGGPSVGDLGPNDGAVDGSMPTDEGVPCTPSGEVDEPDAEFIDTNCDGFDGDLELAVAVVPLGTTAPEGVAASEESIADAIATAESEGLTQVWVAAGDWTETITLVGGISLYGGYDSSNGWQRTRALGSKSRVFGPGPLLVGEGIETATTVALIEFEADDATAGETSIAARLASSTGVRLEDVSLEAGRGGDGSQPARPAQADSGVMGDGGGITGISTGCTFGPALDRRPGGTGGSGCTSCFAGGRGGATSGPMTSAGTSNDGQGGGDGTSFMIGGTRQCAFGADNEGPAPSGAGTVGATGEQGDPGAGGTAGTFTMDGFAPGDGGRGTVGSHGEGGGGGGAAADVEHTSDSDCVYFGASGGGGGGGGCGGARGPGGTGGGASVALWLWDTTVTLVSVTLITANGGDGGDGSRGGAGGDGGPGGAGGPAGSGGSYPVAFTFDPGGMGGPGGPGGEGGAGGGGAGGPSIGIVFGGESSEALTSMDIDFELGAGGAAGIGAGADNDGAAGDSLERFDPEG